jgi:hypothetical protein
MKNRFEGSSVLFLPPPSAARVSNGFVEDIEHSHCAVLEEFVDTLVPIPDGHGRTPPFLRPELFRAGTMIFPTTVIPRNEAFSFHLLAVMLRMNGSGFGPRRRVGRG